jgi:hypothetical protein
MLSPRALPLLVLGFVLVAGTARTVPAQDPSGMPDLVAGLRAVEGNLGVETAQTSSGKQVIFAWFKDKASVLRWYHSDMHRGVQDRFFPDRPPHEPLTHVSDDVGPILAIASITPTASGGVADAGMPVSQIAIELYAPLPGGLSLGGTFAPEALDVPHMIKLGPGGGHEHGER